MMSNTTMCDVNQVMMVSSQQVKEQLKSFYVEWKSHSKACSTSKTLFVEEPSQGSQCTRSPCNDGMVVLGLIPSWNFEIFLVVPPPIAKQAS